jgi:hypothetical protein
VHDRRSILERVGLGRALKFLRSLNERHGRARLTIFQQPDNVHYVLY